MCRRMVQVRQTENSSFHEVWKDSYLIKCTSRIIRVGRITSLYWKMLNLSKSQWVQFNGGSFLLQFEWTIMCLNSIIFVATN